MHPKELLIEDYTYPLPPGKIAAFPLPQRDDSRLLIYKDGNLSEDRYKNIVDYLPRKSLLVFNNTRVIQARLLFEKDTGATIEIFCLEPYEKINEYSTVMATTGKLRWKCMIGGASKWKGGPLIKTVTLDGTRVELQAKLIEKLPGAYVAEFSWQPSHFTFGEIIEVAGRTPLPPYIKRLPEDTDKERYQTIYAKYDGSVAAPTAGLHFTPVILSDLTRKEISTVYLTLHVGAGTFKPVKAGSLEGHQMHAEWIEVTADTLRLLAENMGNGCIAVGTTSLRVLETLYWMGAKAINNKEYKPEHLTIQQWEVYEMPLSGTNVSPAEALNALLKRMTDHNMDRIIAQTSILIAPGYTFRMVTAIITNFHQPQSTLLLLVAAAIGNDWRRVYGYALDNNFRFLSYGDGSLLYLPRS